MDKAQLGVSLYWDGKKDQNEKKKKLRKPDKGKERI